MSVSSVGGASISSLMAYPSSKALPKLGSGIGMFDSLAQASGNSKMRQAVQGSHISVKA